MEVHVYTRNRLAGASHRESLVIRAVLRYEVVTSTLQLELGPVVRVEVSAS